MIKNIKKINKLNLTVVSIIISLIIISSKSFTWQHSSDSKINHIEIADLKVVIEEEFTEPMNVKSNDIINKKVFIYNIGNFPALVRVSFFPYLYDETSGQSLLTPHDSISLLNLSSDWIDGKDGYFYYDKILMQNEKTTNPIISSVLINPIQPSPNYSNIKLDLEVNMEACGISRYYSFQKMWWNYDGVSPLPPPLNNINNQLIDKTNAFFQDYDV